MVIASKYELWSVNEKRVYPPENATLINVDGVMILATPKKEPLLTKVR